MDLFVRVPSSGVSSNLTEQVIWQYFDVGSDQPVSLQYIYPNPTSNPNLISFRVLGFPNQAILLQTDSYSLTNYSGYSQYFHVAVQFTKVSLVGGELTGNYEIFVNGVSADTRTNHGSQKFDGALTLPGRVVGATFRTVIIDEPLLRIGYNYPGNFTVRNTPYVPNDNALVIADSTAALSLTLIDVIVRTTANLESSATAVIIGEKIRFGASNQSARFSQTAIARKTARTSAALSTTATMAVTAVKTARVISNQTDFSNSSKQV
jgi:hypothetical protein